MPIVFIPFDGWSPHAGYFGDGWADATNLYPFFESWRPWRKFDASLSSSVADGPMVGRHAHVWSSGVGTGSYVPDQPTLYTGSRTKLYTVGTVAPFAFTDVSRALGYNVDSAGWRFASVGNDVWATNWSDPMQRRINNAGLFTNGVVSTFKPQPRFMTIVREHLVGANLSNAARFQDEVVWSDADDATNFDPATGTSTSIAGNKRLISIPGQLTGLTGGQYGLAFKRTGIYYLEVTGTTQVFRPDILSANVGTALPSSILVTRYGVFFLGADGFYLIQGLSEPVKISTPGIDQELLDSAFLTRSPVATITANEDMQMFAFQVPGMPLVGWAYRSNWLQAGSISAIMYNPVISQWSSVQVADDTLSQAITALIDLPVGSRPSTSVYDSLAALTWNTTNSQYAPLAKGAATSATFWTATMQLNFRPANFESAGKHGQSTVRGILPVFSKTAVSAAALTPNVTVEAMLDPYLGVYGTPEVRTAGQRDTVAGWYPFMISGRFFRVTIDWPIDPGSGARQPEDFNGFEGLWVDQDVLR